MRIINLFLLQSALQPLWVLACSTIVEYSQQEGFYRVPLPVARQTPNLEDQWLERFNSRHQVSLTSETTRAKVELWARNCREFCRKWRLPRHFRVLLHAVNLRHGADGLGRVWTREVWYQSSARSPLDHHSCCELLLLTYYQFTLCARN